MTQSAPMRNIQILLTVIAVCLTLLTAKQYGGGVTSIAHAQVTRGGGDGTIPKTQDVAVAAATTEVAASNREIASAIKEVAGAIDRAAAAIGRIQINTAPAATAAAKPSGEPIQMDVAK